MQEKQSKNRNSSKKILLISIFINLVFIVLFFSFSNDKTLPRILFNAFHNPEAASSLKIPDTLYFAGEWVPTHKIDTRESLDRELLVNTYWHSQTIYLLKKANRYFEIIEPILEKYNLPNDFKYIPVVEGGLSNTISPASAVGFWQFVEGTAGDYDLEINDEVDERYHIAKSTEAACKFLLESYEKFGNWTLVAASYNIGRRGISRQMDIQKQNNYYNLLLGSETERYVFRLIAFKLIFENPKSYGFDIHPDDLYPHIETDTVMVDSTVNSWADFAINQGINYKTLKIFNPWLRKPYLTNKYKKSYIIEIPKDSLLYVYKPEVRVNENDSI